MDDLRFADAQQRAQSRRAANRLFVDRPRLSPAKQEAEIESAAIDAKTARLRALRLEKEKAEALEPAKARPASKG